MEIRKVSIDLIKPAEYNPRKDLQAGDEEYEKLKRSLQEFDLVEPLVWNERTGNLVGGHQRFKVLLDRGDKEVDVSVVNLSLEKEKALNVALNKIQGDWDYPKLKDLLQELDTGEFDLEITGFDMVEIEDLMTQFHVPEEIIEDEVPEPPEEPITKPGDLWILGRHRLLCGDSTDNEMVDKLMGGVVADICFTSPPYNVGSLNIDEIEETRPKYNSYDDNKTGEEYYNFISTNVKLMLENAKEVFYNIGLVENNKRQIILLLNEFIAQFKDIIYWKKSTVAPHIQSGIINNLVEFILCFGNGKRKFENAQFSQGTYWNVIEGPNASGNKYSNIHKATFPIYLPSNIIENFSPKNGTVIDCFGGTGTTLIACEQLNRTCYMMELDPVYCDVIVQRYINLKGHDGDVYLERDGNKIAFSK